MKILRRIDRASRSASSKRHRFALLACGGAVLAAIASGLATMPQTGDPVQSLLLTTIGSAKANAHDGCNRPVESLQRELDAISAAFPGTVGIAVTRAGCDWVAGARLDRYFPQQSVSKLWVSLTVLDAVDGGTLRLDDPLAIRPQDLTLFHQPLRAEVMEQGMAVRQVQALMTAALTQSDNTANDRLLWAVGGPDRVRRTLRTKAIDGIRFGPGERLLQSGVAGLTWSQDLALGRNFEQARARLPRAEREAALTRYVTDPVDGATPAGMVKALSRLASGQLLSPQSSAVMMQILSQTHSGPRRLKAGAAPGWTVFHKTGTGQELGPVSTGYNDVGLLKAPDGETYAVAVMIAETTRPIPERMALMQAVSRAVGEYHDSLQH